MKLIQAINEYNRHVCLEMKSAKDYIHEMRSFCLYMRGARLADVSESDVVQYFNELEAIGYTHNGVAKKAKVFRSVWRWFNRMGYPTFPHERIPQIKIEWTPQRVASEDGFKRLLAAMEGGGYKAKRDRAIVRMLWDTGARNSEVLSLNVADVDLRSMKAVVRTEKSKGKRPWREIYWTRETNEALRDWMLLKSEIEGEGGIDQPQALFWGINNRSRGGRLTHDAVASMLRGYSKAAKIPAVNAHSFRHRLGHFLAQQGANNSVISSILGHSHLSSSFRYTEMNDKEREAVYAKFMRT